MKSINRIEWLDATKGLAMLMVVVGHVLNSMDMFHHPLNVWIHHFHMPLFFMLSGFLAVKALRMSLWINMKKKIIALMIPFFSCGLVYAIFCDSVDSFLYLLHHAGYWFLLSLFSCWMLFLFAMELCKVIRVKNKHVRLVMNASVVLSPFFIGNAVMSLMSDRMLETTSFPLTFSYYRFFVLGFFINHVITHLWMCVPKYLREWSYALCYVALFIVCLGYLNELDLMTSVPLTIWQIISCVSMLVVMKNSVDYFARPIKCFLVWIGKNSLRLYVFHTFFVYEFAITSFGCLSSGYIVLVAVIVALLVICLTLYITKPIEQHGILALCFLGKSIRKAETDKAYKEKLSKSERQI